MTRTQAVKATAVLDTLGVLYSTGTYRYAAREGVVVTLHLPRFNPAFDKYASVQKWVAAGCPDLDYKSVESFR